MLLVGVCGVSLVNVILFLMLSYVHDKTFEGCKTEFIALTISFTLRFPTGNKNNCCPEILPTLFFNIILKLLQLLLHW